MTVGRDLHPPTVSPATGRALMSSLDFTVSSDGLPSRALRVPEFAAFFGIAPSTAWAMIAEGSVPVLKIGNSTRITPPVMQRILREGIIRPDGKQRARGAPAVHSAINR